MDDLHPLRRGEERQTSSVEKVVGLGWAAGAGVEPVEVAVSVPSSRIRRVSGDHVKSAQ